MVLVLLAGLATAGPPGHTHPTAIAAQSTAYARAAQATSSRFADIEGKTQAMAQALNRYELALDLLGERAPEGGRAHLDALRTRFDRERAVVQAFAQTMMEDFDQEFVAAMERATPDGTQTCQPRIPSGRSLPGMPAPMTANPDCEGENLTGAIVEKMDADPSLNAAIDEILALEWPPVTVPSEPRPAAGPAGGWVAVAPWFDTVAEDPLDRIAREDAEARLPFEAAIEQGATKEELAALTDEARAVTAATARKRATLAAPVLEAVDRFNAKRAKKGRATVAWCAQPAFLGGCTGEDRTESLGPVLREHRKVRKNLP